MRTQRESATKSKPEKKKDTQKKRSRKISEKKDSKKKNTFSVLQEEDTAPLLKEDEPLQIDKIDKDKKKTIEG